MARIECIITGCEFYDALANRWAHGDLHRAGQVLIFNAVTLNTDGRVDTHWQYGEPLHRGCRVVEAHGDYFERRGVIILPIENSRLNADAESYLRGVFVR